MAYDPDRHHRRSIRLPQYDYRQPGAYFVTICVKGRRCLFGQVTEGLMRLNAYGCIAEEEWIRTQTLRPNVQLDAYVIMPNHMHGIVWIIDPARVDDDRNRNRNRRDRMHPVPTAATTDTPTMHHNPTIHHDPPPSIRAFGQPVADSLSTIIGTYKAAVTRRVNRLWNTPGVSLWQSRFYEHVVRNAQDLDRIRRYIARNPQQWNDDRNHP